MKVKQRKVEGLKVNYLIYTNYIRLSASLFNDRRT
jgi:hypothetical protein